MYINSAVFPKYNAYLSHICSGNKTKEFKNMFTQLKKICMHIAYGSTYWYTIDKNIGCVWLKPIGNVCLKRIGSVCLKVYW